MQDFTSEKEQDAAAARLDDDDVLLVSSLSAFYMQIEMNQRRRAKMDLADPKSCKPVGIIRIYKS
jgi:hypothetical protein